jgi:glutamate:GABA antiporter
MTTPTSKSNVMHKKLVNPPRKKVMGRADITFFIFLSMVSVNVTVYAKMGTSVVGWWILACLLFLVPSSLIIAELSTAYPYQGGIYAWVHQAFGRHWAARTTYWYWVNVAMWMPSAFLLFTGALQALGWTSATLWQQSLVCIVLVWITVGCGVARLKLGKSVTDASSITVFAILVVVTIGAFVLCTHRGYTSNQFTLHTVLPNFPQAKLYLPTVVYGFLGMEVVATLSGEAKNPRRDLLTAIPVAGITLAVVQLLATVALLLVIPVNVLGLTTGMIDMYKAIFNSVSPVIVWVLAIATLFTYATGILPWTLGANRAAVEAARDGELPKLFGKQSRWDTPIWAYVLMGLVATVMLLIAATFIKTENGLFFALFASSSAVLILPYLLMYPSIIRLRKTDPTMKRPFRVPGGQVGLWVCVILATASVASSLILFLWTPGAPVDWTYTGPLLAFFGVAVVGGEVLVGWSLRRYKGEPTQAAQLPGDQPEAPSGQEEQAA